MLLCFRALSDDVNIGLWNSAEIIQRKGYNYIYALTMTSWDQWNFQFPADPRVSRFPASGKPIPPVIEMSHWKAHAGNSCPVSMSWKLIIASSQSYRKTRLRSRRLKARHASRGGGIYFLFRSSRPCLFLLHPVQYARKKKSFIHEKHGIYTRK
jgi:hypothetical protein